MKLYTSKVVAQWLGLTERRVRQLRDEGVIAEARPGLYDLQPTVSKYITYIGGAGKESLTQERTKLTKAKREAAELENELRRGEVHRTEDIERGIKTMFLNIRSRFLALPAKLSPTLATLGRPDGHLRRAEGGHRRNPGGNERPQGGICSTGR